MQKLNLIRGFLIHCLLPKSFTHALYYLAAQPELAQTLREEVQSVLKDDGLSREALDKMYKVDSFLKESSRVSPNTVCAYSLLRCLSIANVID